jgi:EpsI family protein
MNVRLVTLGLAAALLAGQFALQNFLNREEFLPNPAPLAEIPTQFTGWALLEEPPMDPEQLDMLSPDSYLSRVYRDQRDDALVTVFVAYYRTQLRAKNAHDPKICLPGAGWNPVQSDIATFQFPQPVATVPSNRYVIAKGNSRNLVAYWFQMHDSAEAREQALRWRRVFSMTRENRSDMALVRFITPVREESVDAAWQRIFRLAQQFYPYLMERFPPTPRT